jgi:hypothetical protein
MSTDPVKLATRMRIIQRVAELPDRTSPDDWPDVMLVTAEELSAILREELEALVLHESPPADESLVRTLEVAQRWLANCVPVVEIDGPKPLTLIAAALEKLTSAGHESPPAPEQCKGCQRGLPVLMLDDDGVRVDVSGRPGKPSHAVEDSWWLCAAKASRADLIAENARLRDLIPTCAECAEVILDNGDIRCSECSSARGEAPLPAAPPEQLLQGHDGAFEACDHPGCVEHKERSCARRQVGEFAG